MKKKWRKFQKEKNKKTVNIIDKSRNYKKYEIDFTLLTTNLKSVNNMSVCE